MITGDTAWVVDTAGVLTALALATGKPRWHVDLDVPVLGGLAVSGDWLVIASYDGTIRALAARTSDPSCTVLSTGGCCDARHAAPSPLALAILVWIVRTRRRLTTRNRRALATS